MLARIEHILSSIGSPGRFAARRSASPGGLRVSVKGIGTIDLPVTATAVEHLRTVAKKAPYGRRDETLVDERVRDTWEIAGDRVRVDERYWSSSLSDLVDELRAELGLPDRTRLRAELDKMLIYEPGQFFLPHQDTEKTDGMIATLLLILPSTFTGGSLRVMHGGKTVTVKASKKAAKEVTLVAFYADCRHEVTPLEAGHRVVLSYNLVAKGGTAEALTFETGTLEDAVERYFATPKPEPSYSRWEPPKPDRLVYLLDHEYTERGLSWRLLKNGDARRAEALRAAAESKGCGVALAPAEVHENWECVWQSQKRDYIILSEVTLGRAVDPKGRAVTGHENVASDEVCETLASVKMNPYRTEYEPYMGNYGNTEDRWYRRAAVILWRRDREFLIRAKSAPVWALGEIARGLRKGHVEIGRSRARELLPFFRRTDDPQLFNRALEVAPALGDAQIASGLLDWFKLADLTPAHAEQLAALVDAYGLEWCEARIHRWAGEG